MGEDLKAWGQSWAGGTNQVQQLLCKGSVGRGRGKAGRLDVPSRSFHSGSQSDGEPLRSFGRRHWCRAGLG